MPEIKHKFNEDIENRITKQVVDEEYAPAKTAKSLETIEFESTVDMLECKRNEKDYDWMSDIFIPELPSIILTDASNWAAQYFQTRDFVEVKLEGTNESDKKKCGAAKKCLNQTLNRLGLHHYQKYIRARTINALNGQVYIVCWWEKKKISKVTGYRDETEQLEVDIYGNQVQDESQVPATRTSQVPVMGEEIVYDHFAYDVIDPRNVFTDGKYVYSVQDKDWVSIRMEKSYDDLKSAETKNSYFNLDVVKELVERQGKTETSKETYNKGERDKEGDKPVLKYFDVILRFGKLPCIVKSRSEDGNPMEIVPGYTEAGDVEEKKVEYIDTITETVYSGNTRVLIRFQSNPFRNSKGVAYKPIVRGWCYIHPTKDIGLSDGKYLREIQVGINDSFNMGMDRVKLATLPTLKGNRNSLVDNQTIYFAPEHVMELDNPADDIVEFKIRDDINGVIQVQSMLTSKGQQAVAVYPTTMGQLPAASTTATAVAGAEQRGNIRANYKSLTFEYTFLLEFYWMILQMSYAFMEEGTAIAMMGDDSQFFDPDADYSYTPVSSNIETEYNKNKKIQLYDQTLSRIVPFAQTVPAVIPIIAHIIARQLVLQGDEYQDIGGMIEKLATSQPQPEPGQGGAPQPQSPEGNMNPESNQSGNPMSEAEQGVRGIPTRGF